MRRVAIRWLSNHALAAACGDARGLPWSLSASGRRPYSVRTILGRKGRSSGLAAVQPQHAAHARPDAHQRLVGDFQVYTPPPGFSAASAERMISSGRGANCSTSTISSRSKRQASPGPGGVPPDIRPDKDGEVGGYPVPEHLAGLGAAVQCGAG